MTTVCRGFPVCHVEWIRHAKLPFRSQPTCKRTGATCIASFAPTGMPVKLLLEISSGYQPAISAVRRSICLTSCLITAVPKPGRLVVSASTQQDSNKDRAAATPAQSSKDFDTSTNNLPEEGSNPRRQKRKAGSSDWIASAVTRRFGLAGGLIWVGVLTFGVLSEQIKTRIEQADEAKSTQVVSGGQEVVLPSGVKYKDVKIGGGSKPQKGYLMIVDFRATADGDVFEDTRERGKPIVFIYGGRPFTGGLCKGVEEAMATMKAGGRRTVSVPPSLGFGENGGSVAPTLHAPGKQGVIPRDAVLTYDLELIRVSIPPS